VKKQNRSRNVQGKQVRTLEQAALADATAGTDPQAVPLVEPYLPHQHNETILRACRPPARRGAGRARARSGAAR
jgi:hypothetical protein